MKTAGKDKPVFRWPVKTRNILIWSHPDVYSLKYSRVSSFKTQQISGHIYN